LIKKQKQKKHNLIAILLFASTGWQVWFVRLLVTLKTQNTSLVVIGPQNKTPEPVVLRWFLLSLYGKTDSSQEL